MPCCRGNSRCACPDRKIGSPISSGADQDSESAVTALSHGGVTMLKSIAVVIGSYLLSVVLVLATDPLLSRLFPGDFAKGHIPSNNALMASTALFVLVSILCAWVCARFAPSRA